MVKNMWYINIMELYPAVNRIEIINLLVNMLNQKMLY